MQNIDSKKLKKYGVIAIISVVVICITYGVISYIININDQQITVSNLTSLSKMPKNTIEEIQKNAFGIVKHNNEEKSDNEIAALSVKARDFKEEVKNKIYSGRFIFDVDEYKQSYVIYFTWTNDQTKDIEDEIGSYLVTSGCPKINELKYDYFKCGSPYYDDDSEYGVVTNILPYSEGNFKALEPDVYYEHPYKYIEIDVVMCNKEGSLDNELSRVKGYIEGYGINPELFTYEMRGKCGNKIILQDRYIGIDNPDKEALEEIFKKSVEYDEKEHNEEYYSHA
ncbi:MAG: hypothetical protein Q4E47_03165 [Candidatus Saccharibacteria bacterium]|nr:hypothetical protein [Candidatus Saccharibacteria bacterium]